MAEPDIEALKRLFPAQPTGKLKPISQAYWLTSEERDAIIAALERGERLEKALKVVAPWVRLLGPDAGTSAGGVYLNSPVLRAEETDILRAALEGRDG